MSLIWLPIGILALIIGYLVYKVTQLDFKISSYNPHHHYHGEDNE